jgi:heme A synthase
MDPAAGFGRRVIVAAVMASVVALGGWVSVAEAALTYCPGGALTLSGGTSPAETIGVDDDLELRLNGVTIFRNAGPIRHGTAADHLHHRFWRPPSSDRHQLDRLRRARGH